MIKDFNWVSLETKRAAYDGAIVDYLAAHPAAGYVLKAVDPDDVDLTCDDEDKHIVIATISTDKIDRDGEIVLPKGMDLTDFRKQPAVYFQHDSNALPLGPCLWIAAKEKKIIAKYQVVTKASELHAALWELIKAGAYRSHSVGFLSKDHDAPSPQELRFHPEWKGARAVHRKTSLLEFSLVGMPSNTDAVTMAISKGYSEAVVKFFRGNEGTAEPIKETEIIAPTESEIRRSFYGQLSKVLKSNQLTH